jgi:hypothetical protein
VVRLAAEVCASDPDLQMIYLAHCPTGNVQWKYFEYVTLQLVMLAIDPPH